MSWWRACLLILPAGAAAFLAAWLGVFTLYGALSLVFCVAYLSVDLVVLQPRLATIFSPDAHWLRAIENMRRQAPPDSSLSEIALWIREITLETLGTTRALLVITESKGKPLVVGGNTDDNETVRDFARTVDWLAQRHQVTLWDQASVAAELFKELGCRAAVPVAGGRACLLLAGTELVAAEDFCLALAARVGTLLVRSKFVAAARGSWDAVVNDFVEAAKDAIMPGQQMVHSEGFAVKGVLRAAANRGGDFWTWRALGRGKILVVVGQCQGAGVDRVFAAATSKGAIDAHAISELGQLRPAALLASVSDMLVERELTRGVAVFAAVFDRVAGEICYASGGEASAPLLLAAGHDGGPIELSGPSTAAIGSQSGLKFEEQCRAMAPGSRLVLFTSGVAAMGGEDGTERLRAMVARFAGRSTESLPSTVLSHLRRFLRGRASEDLTLLVVERVAP